MDLDELRVELDKIDEELVNLIAKRVELIPSIAEYKKAKGVARVDDERESQLIEAKRKLALELGVNPDLIEDIFKRLIEESHVIEKKIIGE